MNRSPGVDRVLRDYFADDGLLAPDHVLDVVEERILRQPQRRTWRVPWRDTRVNTYFKPLLAVVAIVVVAVAGLALLRPSGPAIGGPPASASSPAPSPNPTPSPTSAPSSSVDVGVEAACDLMTGDEARNALHISSLVTTESLQHPRFDAVVPPSVPTAFCGFRSGGTPLFVLRYEDPGADAFAIWKKQPGVEAVSGLGDDAAWARAKSALYILKGDRLVTIMPLAGQDPTMTLEAARAIGAIVATRM